MKPVCTPPIPPDEMLVGLIAFLGRPSSHSIIYPQVGGFLEGQQFAEHPVLILKSGKIVEFLPVTSFGGEGICAKYPDRNDSRRESYFEIDHKDRGGVKLGWRAMNEMASPKMLRRTPESARMAKRSWTNTDRVYRIEGQYVRKLLDGFICIDAESMERLLSVTELSKVWAGEGWVTYHECPGIRGKCYNPLRLDTWRANTDMPTPLCSTFTLKRSHSESTMSEGSPEFSDSWQSDGLEEDVARKHSRPVSAANSLGNWSKNFFSFRVRSTEFGHSSGEVTCSEDVPCKGEIEMKCQKVDFRSRAEKTCGYSGSKRCTGKSCGLLGALLAAASAAIRNGASNDELSQHFELYGIHNAFSTTKKLRMPGSIDARDARLRSWTRHTLHPDMGESLASSADPSWRKHTTLEILKSIEVK